MKIQTGTRDGVGIMRPIDRIIGPASAQFRRAIMNEMAGAPESPNFLFDFTGVPRIDSVGIGVLTALHVSIAERGGKVGVINVGDHIRSVFVKAKLITIFKHFTSENEAIVNLRYNE